MFFFFKKYHLSTGYRGFLASSAGEVFFSSKKLPCPPPLDIKWCAPYGTKCPPKYMGLPYMLMNWLHVSDYRNFWNNERWSLWNLINSLASFNCFTDINLFQNGANDMSKMVNMVNDCLSKSSKFCVVRIIRFCWNIASLLQT